MPARPAGEGRGERAAPGYPSPLPLGSSAPLSWGISTGEGMQGLKQEVLTAQAKASPRSS